MKKGKKYKALYIAEREKRKKTEEKLEKARRDSSDHLWWLILMLMFTMPPERTGRDDVVCRGGCVQSAGA